jgi:hypothetical protein
LRKDNQPGLHRQVHNLCASSIDTGRNRQERRTVAVFNGGDSIADPDWRACAAASPSVSVVRQWPTQAP